MSAVDQTGIAQETTLLPSYQETFLKDLLANVYQSEAALDAEGNPILDETGQPIYNVSGIAADSPLFGTPVLDEQGNQVFETDPTTGEPLLDFRGQPIPMVEGGVRRPDVAPLTPNQIEAIRLAEEGVGAFAPMFDQAQAALGGFQLDDAGNIMRDPATGEPIQTGAIAQVGKGMETLGKGVTQLVGTTGQFDTSGVTSDIDAIDTQIADAVSAGAAGIRGETDTAQAGIRGAGAGIAGQVTSAQADQQEAARRAREATAQAQQDLTAAGDFGLGAAAQGISQLEGTTGRFDPSGVGGFMSQFEDAAVQQAIQDIARAGQIQRNQLGAQAVGAGAFGGSREAVAAQELGRNILEQQGRTAAQMRQAGFESAADRAQRAFEDEQARTQASARLTGDLGQAGAGSAMDAARAGGQLALSAEELAQTGALSGGELGLTGQTSLADIEQAAGQMGVTGEQTAAGLELTGAGQQADLTMGLAGLDQTAFEDSMRRGQNASQIFADLGRGQGGLASVQADIGTGQAALGESAQQAGQSDVNALFNIGALEQGQMQSEYDVQRQADIEEAYEPFQRFAYMSDIAQGVPSSASTMAVTAIPAPSPVSNIIGTTQGIDNYQQATGRGLFG